MPKMMIKSSLYVATASLLLMFAALLFIDWKFPQQSDGQLVFAETYSAIGKLDRIKLVTPFDTITLEQKDGFWTVKELNNYFADTGTVNRLLSDINNSTFYSRQNYSAADAEADLLSEKNGVLVQTYAGDKLLDSVIVGKAVADDRYHFVRRAKKQEIWLADGIFKLPMEKTSWILQPIAEFQVDSVESVDFEGIKLSRDNVHQMFGASSRQENAVKSLLSLTSVIMAEDVIKEESFVADNYPQRRLIKLTSFEGLIAEYALFSDANEDWLKINLSTAPLAKSRVSDYIREHRIFYDGWYFKIPAVQGEMLLSASISSTQAQK